MDSLSSSSLARIETVLEDLVKEVRKGKRAATIVSVHETDDVSIWRELESELSEEDISKEDVERHKVAIKTYLKGLMGVAGSRPPSPGRLTATLVGDGIENDDDSNRDSISLRMAQTNSANEALTSQQDNASSRSDISSQAGPIEDEESSDTTRNRPQGTSGRSSNISGNQGAY